MGSGDTVSRPSASDRAAVLLHAVGGHRSIGAPKPQSGDLLACGCAAPTVDPRSDARFLVPGPCWGLRCPSRWWRWTGNRCWRHEHGDDPLGRPRIIHRLRVEYLAAATLWYLAVVDPWAESEKRR